MIIGSVYLDLAVPGQFLWDLISKVDPGPWPRIKRIKRHRRGRAKAGEQIVFDLDHRYLTRPVTVEIVEVDSRKWRCRGQILPSPPVEHADITGIVAQNGSPHTCRLEVQYSLRVTLMPERLAKLLIVAAMPLIKHQARQAIEHRHSTAQP